MADNLPPPPAGYTVDTASLPPPPSGYSVSQPSGGGSPQGQTQQALYSALSSSPVPGVSSLPALIETGKGALKGAASTVFNSGDLIRRGEMGIAHAFGVNTDKIPEGVRSFFGLDRVIDKPGVQAAITPTNTPQKIGKFLEQGAEFAVPVTKASTALKGAGVLARVATQAGIGAGVSAAQSGGDPQSTIVGGVLGGGAELAGAASEGAKSLLAAKSPTLANFAESFGGATPTQKARITDALQMLSRDGVVPPDTVHETQDLIKGKLDDLSQAYNHLDPAIRGREVDPNAVIGQLRKAQGQYMRRGVVTDDAAHTAIENQIGKVQAIADANGGKINIDDLVHMKQNANGRTNWQSNAAEKSLWENIGDAYRGAADRLAPETTPINRDFQQYKDLEHIIDQNIARGKGTTPSGLDVLLKRAAQHGVGATAGASIGGAVMGPTGAAGGALLGGLIGPKLGKAAGQALQNAVDSGAFTALSPVKQAFIKSRAALGDNTAVLKMLGTSATEESAVRRR